MRLPTFELCAAFRYRKYMTGTTQKKADIEQLSQPVQFLKGVGPQRAQLLQKLGLRTVADLLFFFPRNYHDYSQLASIAELQEARATSVIGRVLDIQDWTSAAGKYALAVLLEQEPQQYLRGIWFNQHYLKQKFENGQLVMLQGTPRFDEGRWEMVHPKITWFALGEPAPTRGTIAPIYPLTQGLAQPKIRDIVAHVVAEHCEAAPEVFPQAFRSEKGLCDIHTAIRQIHAPRDEQSLELARHRFVYQELFVLQAALAMRRQRIRNSQTAPAMPLDSKIRARILRRFPFELSPDQLQAADDISRDMSDSIPMNRLVHGEVGSGKTAVAAFAVLLAIAHGYQAVIMAPTELLARQHVRSFAQWLKHARVRIAAWTGAQTASQRKSLAAEVASGRYQLVIGTHALLASPPDFKNLGLVVIDEQHKFGVRQRGKLRQAGGDPHYLVMTATPIPRTIAMTAFGDLDVSTLQKPARQSFPVHTYLGSEETRDAWWEFVRNKLREGRQAYVIAPLVEGDDDSQVSGAESMLESLANGPLEAFRLDVLHGRQKSEEKESIMLAFARGHTQALVATSVVEVGIDVPNATVMTIESAERFGLSQLHQLRGRVSRGSHTGYVTVFPSTKNEHALKRLQAFVESQNGFELAELDFQMRGPGNLFSGQQHGMPPLRIADLLRDHEILQTARQDAQTLIAADPELGAPEFARLHQMIVARYGRALEISDVG